MFEVRTEGLSSAEASELESVSKRVAELAGALAKQGGDRTRWFGKNHNTQQLSANLKALGDYLNSTCTLLTFVRKKTGQIIDQVAAESSDYGQVIGNIDTTTANFQKSAKHVSSGLRIFAMNEIVNAIKDNDTEEKLNYVYHEISHKVIDTVDYEYGKSDCLNLAVNKPGLAIRNADNYGYFLAEYAAKNP